MASFLSERPVEFPADLKTYKGKGKYSKKSGGISIYSGWTLLVPVDALKHMEWTGRKGKFRFVPNEARDRMILFPPDHKPKPPFDFERKALGQLKKPFKCREWEEEDFEALNEFIQVTPHWVHITPPQRNKKNRRLRRIFNDQKKRNFKDYQRFMKYKYYKYLVEDVPQDHAAGTESVQRI